MSDDFPDPWEPGGIDSSTVDAAVTGESSTIYIQCPQCKKYGLLIERQGKYFCAVCMFDYTELKDDPVKLDEVLIENMEMGGFGPLFASTLYQRVSLASPRDANEYIEKLAQENGIELYGKLEVKLLNLLDRSPLPFHYLLPLIIVISIILMYIILAILW